MSKGLWSRKKFTSVVMDPGDIKYFLNLFFNFFIHFTYEPKCPPPLHSFSSTSHLLFRDGKASHWESTVPGLLSWGRTKALLFASRLSKLSNYGERAPKSIFMHQAYKSWSHCQEDSQLPPHIQEAHFGPMQAPQLWVQIPWGSTRSGQMLCGFSLHDLDNPSTLFIPLAHVIFPAPLQLHIISSSQHLAVDLWICF